MGSARSCLLIRRVESMDSVLSTVASCGAPETIYLRLFDAGAHSPGCTDGVDRAWVCGEAGMRLVLRCTSMLLESKRALHVMCLSAMSKTTTGPAQIEINGPTPLQLQVILERRLRLPGLRTSNKERRKAHSLGRDEPPVDPTPRAFGGGV